MYTYGAILQGGEVARRAGQLPQAELELPPVAVRVDFGARVVHRAALVLEGERLLEELERRLGGGWAEEQGDRQRRREVGGAQHRRRDVGHSPRDDGSLAALRHTRVRTRQTALRRCGV